MMECDFDRTERELLCTFAGRMDNASSSGLEAELNERLLASLAQVQGDGSSDGGSIRVVFDLDGVGYIASLFIRLCIATAKRPELGSFAISNTNALVKKTFKIAGLDDMLNVS